MREKVWGSGVWPLRLEAVIDVGAVFFDKSDSELWLWFESGCFFINDSPGPARHESNVVYIRDISSRCGNAEPGTG
jgi:hypothetical protein